MKIAIYGKLVTEGNIPYLKNLFKKLLKESIKFSVQNTFAEHLRSLNIEFAADSEYNSYEDLDKSVDCLISIGGDGTFLDTIALVRDSGVPLVGINAGNLGFLSNISKDEIDYAIDEILAGNFTLDKRALLSVETEDKLFGEVNFALNDLTIH